MAPSMYMAMTIEGYEHRERILVSYDVSNAPQSRRVRVCRMIFGRNRTDATGRMRQEKGFIHRPGVVWIGQSVLVMPPRDATELEDRLSSLGVRVSTGRISIDAKEVERFRRR
jgi:hypothetical protein